MTRPAFSSAGLYWLPVLALAVWIYWPGLSGPAILDDASNLQVLEALNDNPEYARDMVLGNESGPTGRPLSMLSFALERLYLGDSIETSKRINLLLHLLTATVLMLLLSSLLSRRDAATGRQLAILLAAFWLLSPLFVSTVLYPVQRMAQLACLFVLISLLLYAQWRIRRLDGGLAWPYLMLLPLAIVAAGTSKENGLLALPLVVLLEVFWFQFRDAGGEVSRAYARATWFGIIAASLAFLAYLYSNPALVTGPYAFREFTILERLMTQGRVLWDYIGQFLTPDVLRMGVYHDDVQISRSLSEPGSTLWAWLAWLAVAAILLFAAARRRSSLYVFAALLFLVGHSVESSVLGLEIYYEHRNYLPSAGILLLLGLVIQDILKRLPEMRRLLFVVLGIYVGMQALKTSSQAQVWSRDDLIRMTVFNAHPESYRATINMAVLLASKGGLSRALDLSLVASQLKSERLGDRSVRDLVLSCYANQALPPAYLDALPIWQARDRVISETNALHYLVLMLQNGQCDRVDVQDLADRFAVLLLTPDSNVTVTAQVYAGFAVLENSLQGYDRALAYTEQFLLLEPESAQALLMRLHFATALDRDVVVEDSVDRLSSLRMQGRLTQQQQDTLDLYVSH